MTTACALCKPGYTTNGEVGSTCQECGAGSFSTGGLNGAKGCTLCPLGLVSGPAASQCEKCDAGDEPNAAQSACVKCPPGYSSLEGKACAECSELVGTVFTSGQDANGDDVYVYPPDPLAS